jgi:DNA-binding phage protein
MGKKTTLKKQEISFENMKEHKYKNKEKDGIVSYSPRSQLLDKEFMALALWMCIIEYDMDSFKEILGAHLDIVNKEKMAKKAGISKRTLFRMISPEGNPTLESVSRIMKQIYA